MRATQCYVLFGNVSKTIDNSFCIDAGLEAPETIRNCGKHDCPVWQTGQWSDVSSIIVLIAILIIDLNDYNINDLQCDQCLDLRIGVQSREVRCTLNNGTLLDNRKCHSLQKPIAQKQCVNHLCEGTWITGDWTQVSNC